MTIAFSLAGTLTHDGRTLLVDDPTRMRRQCEALFRLGVSRVVLTVERETHSRSAAQNRAYWGLIVTPCSDSSGYEPDEVHEILKRFCNPKTVMVKGEDVVIGGSTTSLNVEEFSAYYKRCQQFASEHWDCYCPEPNEDAQFSETVSRRK